MDLMQLIRISVILGLIAAINALVYFIALGLNTHYKHKLALHRMLPSNILKKKAPSYSRAARVPDAVPAVEEAAGVVHAVEEPIRYDAPEPCQEMLPGVPVKFALGDRVEFFGSRGEMAGKIISFNNSNSKREYRYLVDWEKNGIWWVSEDQIEHSEHKGIEVNA